MKSMELKKLYEKLDKLKGKEFSEFVLDTCDDYVGVEKGIAIGYNFDEETKYCEVPIEDEDCIEVAIKLGVEKDFCSFSNYKNFDDFTEEEKKYFNEDLFDFYSQYDEEVDKYEIEKNKDIILNLIEDLIAEAVREEEWGK